MTVGKDVSALFPDVVNCMQTDNLELKKLVYLYLMNYAKSQPDMAIMAVNTFVKVSALNKFYLTLVSEMIRSEGVLLIVFNYYKIVHNYTWTNRSKSNLIYKYRLTYKLLAPMCCLFCFIHAKI